MHYYERLDKTIQEATDFSRNLRYPRDGPPPDGTQIARVVAQDLQGVLGSELYTFLTKHASEEAYIEAVRSKVAGDFVEYGVSGNQLLLIADALMATPEHSPSAMQNLLPPQQKHPHPIVERARVRVFEAEITHLPLAFVEKLVKTRRSMRRFKSRIDLHVRIILALEGKGRKASDAQLDRLKLQLEKADQQAENERKRRAAAEAARLEKERRGKEAAKQSERSGLREKQLKKRRRQEHAQASFMKRFVKPKIEERQGEDAQEVRYVPRERSGYYAQEVAGDPDVMSVDWWLLSELQFVSVSKLDEQLKEGASDLKSHLRACAVRRKEAEKNINGVLQDYRARRRVPCDDRYPRFTKRRAEVRGRWTQGPIKLLQFDENYRPAYYGTFRKSKVVSGRRPFRKDSELNYEHDSEAEWEEEEGEDIQDVEDDKERANEEAELRKLYGSDDEDDDDFLDDDEAGDDDDDDDEEDENGDQDGEGDKKDKGGDIVDLTKNTGKELQKARDSGRGKRRKSSVGSVVIESVSFTGASKLDAYPVSTLLNSKPIQMFNPFVFSASDIVAEHLKAKVPSTRPSRPSNIDEQAKLDLAVALVNDGSNRDRIVLQFCENRRTKGLNVPAKSEVVRAISEMATREKRDGDSRAVWHLNDAKLERMVQQMGSARRTVPTAGPITTPVSAMK
ncbi:Chromatin assembly factor 1 subunit A [Gracilaria domingensis]|nr:Chromatin assembly factor 1 subunit A [Gracilaria domingensis]